MQEHSFHQSEYEPAEIKLTDVVGFAYKFTLLIPITENGEYIFSEEKEEELKNSSIWISAAAPIPGM